MTSCYLLSKSVELILVSFFVLSVLINVVSSEEDEGFNPATIMTRMNECAEEKGIKISELGRMYLQEDDQMNCFEACIWQKIGLFTDDFKFNFTSAEELIKGIGIEGIHDVMTEIATTCGEKVNELDTNDVCEMAKSLGECRKDKLKDYANDPQLKQLAAAINFKF